MSLRRTGNHVLNAGDVVALVRDEMLKAFNNEANQLDIIDRWARWDHDKPHAPRVSTTEYKQLADRSHTPWLMVPVMPSPVSSMLRVIARPSCRTTTRPGPPGR